MKLKQNWNETFSKQFWNCFLSVLFQTVYSWGSVALDRLIFTVLSNRPVNLRLLNIVNDTPCRIFSTQKPAVYCQI